MYAVQCTKASDIERERDKALLTIQLCELYAQTRVQAFDVLILCFVEALGVLFLFYFCRHHQYDIIILTQWSQKFNTVKNSINSIHFYGTHSKLCKIELFILRVSAFYACDYEIELIPFHFVA